MSSGQIFGWLSPLISWILATGFLLTWWRWSPKRYVLAVAATYFFMGLGLSLSYATRDWSPLLHFLPSQIMYFTALISMTAAFCWRAHKTVPIEALLVTSGIAIGVSAFLHNSGMMPDARLAITNLGQGMILGFAALTIRPTSGTETSTDKRLYWIVVLTALQFFIRPAVCYVAEGSVGIEEFRASLYWAVLNATLIAFSLLLAISLAMAIAADIIKQNDRHRRSVDSILTKEELEMLLKP